MSPVRVVLADDHVLLRAIGSQATPPCIIFLSMHDNQEYRSAAHELGARFVSKADLVNELIPTLEAMARLTARPAEGSSDHEHVS